MKAVRPHIRRKKRPQLTDPDLINMADKEVDPKIDAR